MFWTYLTAFLAILASYGLFKFWQMVRMRSYWKKKGFPYLTIEESGGDSFLNLFKGVQLQDQDKQFYKSMKEKNFGVAGVLEFKTPILVIRDLDILRSMFVKDFDHFVDHREFIIDRNSKKWTTKMLFFMEGEAWKGMRTKMSPTFTTGKIRRMFDIFSKSSKNLVGLIDENLKTSKTVDFVEAYGKYTLDVISSAAFGLESGAFLEKKSLFEKMAEKLQFKLTFKFILQFITIMFVPKIASLLNFQIFPYEACHFFSSTISNTIAHRKKTGEKRDDFLQLMLEASAGQLKTEESELSNFEKEAIVNGGKKSATKEATLSEDMICAQSILFFLAGFDTVQSLLQMAAYQLAVSQDVQETLLEEVTETFRRNGDKFTYESINEMEYMDKFVCETLRMFPPVPRLDRKCVTAYKIPGTDLVIPAGTDIAIPAFSIHRDEDIYPDPERFDPERFTKEARAQRNPYAYMPFGSGPRNCIGMRFALTEAKLALAHLVQNFHMEPSASTPIPIKFAKAASLKPEGGLNLNLRRRQGP